MNNNTNTLEILNEREIAFAEKILTDELTNAIKYIEAYCSDYEFISPADFKAVSAIEQAQELFDRIPATSRENCGYTQEDICLMANGVDYNMFKEYERYRAQKIAENSDYMDMDKFYIKKRGTFRYIQKVEDFVYQVTCLFPAGNYLFPKDMELSELKIADRELAMHKLYTMWEKNAAEVVRDIAEIIDGLETSIEHMSKQVQNAKANNIDEDTITHTEIQIEHFKRLCDYGLPLCECSQN